MGLMDRIKEEASSAVSATFDTTPQPQQRLQNQQPQQVYQQPMQQRVPRYVVLQVTLKEKMIGTGSGNLSELEAVINKQCAQGFRLHTISTASGGSAGLIGGDRIQATMVFEQII